ncbi:hypothetical protein ACOMHN_032309 [Nucella lapillus]
MAAKDTRQSLLLLLLFLACAQHCASASDCAAACLQSLDQCPDDDVVCSKMAALCLDSCGEPVPGKLGQTKHLQAEERETQSHNHPAKRRKRHETIQQLAKYLLQLISRKLIKDDKEMMSAIGKDLLNLTPIESNNQQQPISIVERGSWNKRQPIRIKTRGSWNKRQPIKVEERGSWNKRQPIDAAKTESWNKQPINIDERGSWNKRQPMEIGESGNWNKRQPISMDRRGSWNKRQAIDSEESQNWVNQQLIKIDERGSWNKRQPIDTKETENWMDQQPIRVVERGSWNKRGSWN